MIRYQWFVDTCSYYFPYYIRNGFIWYDVFDYEDNTDLEWEGFV